MNAAYELLHTMKNIAAEIDLPLKVVAAEVSYEVSENKWFEFTLYKDHSNVEHGKFWEFLDAIEYNNTCGVQRLYGTVWLDDGSWLKAVDGSEWWEHHYLPDMPTR